MNVLLIDTDLGGFKSLVKLSVTSPCSSSSRGGSPSPHLLSSLSVIYPQHRSLFPGRSTEEEDQEKDLKDWVCGDWGSLFFQDK